eukprot:2221174-Amphidinium_carterae.1
MFAGSLLVLGRLFLFGNGLNCLSGLLLCRSRFFLPWLVLHFPSTALTLMHVALGLGFLRTVELLRVRKTHVVLGSANSLVVLLPLTKVSRRRGAPERVPIEDALTFRWVSHCVRQLSGNALLFQGSAHQFCVFFSCALGAVGLETDSFKLYSLCCGGATHLFVACKVCRKLC